MKLKSRHSLLLLVIVMLIAGSCAAPAVSVEGKLQVNAKHPQTGIQQGQLFDLELKLSNPDTVNANVKEIRFESNFFEWASYEGSIPPLSMETQANGDGVIKLDMTIAPTGVEDFVFRFRANKSGEVQGDWQVVTGSVITAIETQMSIAGTTPTGWDPGVSPEEEAPDLGPIPYQAVVQITAFVDIDGEAVPRWTGSGTIISPDGLILTNDHVVSSTRYEEVVALLVSLTVAQDQPPVDSYYAHVVQADAALDLAVIKPAQDMEGNDLDYNQLKLPFVPLGDSDTLDLGEAIVILGYPVIGAVRLHSPGVRSAVLLLRSPLATGLSSKPAERLQVGTRAGWRLTRRGKSLGSRPSWVPETSRLILLIADPCGIPIGMVISMMMMIVYPQVASSMLYARSTLRGT